MYNKSKMAGGRHLEKPKKLPYLRNGLGDRESDYSLKQFPSYPAQLGLELGVGLV